MAAATSLAPADPARGAEETNGAGHLYWLDWLRFLAAVLVVADHTREFNWSRWYGNEGGPRQLVSSVFLSLTQLGRAGVVVFFVLSGLLVGGRPLARARRGTFDAASYAADRIARIYVPLLPALGLTLAITLWCGQPCDPGRFAASLAGLQGSWVANPTFNAPLWTLAYEMWFYVLAGCAAVAAMQGGPRGRRLAAAMGALGALAMFLKLDGIFLTCWLLGAAGFWLDARLGRQRRGWLALAGAGVAAGGVAVHQVATGTLPPLFDPADSSLPPADFWLLFESAGVLLAVVCLMHRRPTTRAGAWLERQGTPLAAFSYTLYLTHFPVLYLLAERSAKLPHALTGPSLVRAGVWMAVCFAVARAMYALFEVHTPAVRRWLRAKFAGTPTFRPSAALPPELVRPSLVTR